jgi:DNA-binding MarR family transcriptional regulator
VSQNPLQFDRLAALDKTIHEPARLAILSALSACQSASFMYLLNLTGLTQGNLHVHLTKLKRRRLIQIDKSHNGSYSSTSVSLSDTGRKAIARHWQQLANLKLVAAQLPNDALEGTGAVTSISRSRSRK